VPWWGALLLAITATVVGYAIDAGSGHKELTHVFAVFYISGCVAAALAVRQEGLFTAIIQPPLILFCAVPGAYWLFHERKVGHLKDLLINCGYPLIERFPLMLGTAGGVLLIGLVRWYFGMSYRTAAAAETKNDAKDDADAATPAESRSFFGAVTAKLNSLLGIASQEDGSGERGAKRTRGAGPPRKGASGSGRAARGDRSAARPSRTHSRHSRRPLEDEQEPVAERPRRRRPAPPRDVDPADPPRRSRRRPPPHGDPERRDPDRRAQPREARSDPRPSPRNPYEWPYERAAPHSGRFDGYDRYEPPHEPPRRRGTRGRNGDNPTHHPISRVRYRGSGPLDEARAEPGIEYGSRPRPRRPPADESWEYDV
jgi:hypothetical protein